MIKKPRRPEPLQQVAPWRRASLAGSRAVQPQHDDLGGSRFRRPRNHRKTVGHGDFLLTVHAISDHSAADPAAAAEFLPPEFLARRRIERIEVAAQVAKEDDAPSGRSD